MHIGCALRSMPHPPADLSVALEYAWKTCYHAVAFQGRVLPARKGRPCVALSYNWFLNSSSPPTSRIAKTTEPQSHQFCFISFQKRWPIVGGAPPMGALDDR